METKMMRFLEMSVQAFALASVWRGASAMVASGVTTEQLGFLQTLEPLAIPGAMLAVIGSVAATQIGIRGWRRLQKAAQKDRAAQPQPIDEPMSSVGRHDQLVADLQNQVIELNKEKELLNRLLQEKSACLRQDPLTGVFNRLAYEEQLEQEFHRWKRFGNPLTFLIWDIDHFKQINDRHGHATGDEVLRSIAQQLVSRVRSTDFVARYGGEEFVMLLPGADIRAASSLADQIRCKIAECGFQNAGSNIPVTISCGISSFEPGDTPQSVFSRADRALYQAKQAGRDCCQVL